MNLLITSCGTRNKILQYFKKEMKSTDKLVATDCSPFAPALYEADKYYIVPRIDNQSYINTILQICEMEKINGILSLIDQELSLLSYHEGLFKEKGIMVIGSSYFCCELALDKWKTYKWLISNGFKCAKTFKDINSFFKAVNAAEINYPVFVKPRRGSASNSIFKVYNKETIESLFLNYNDLIIQEFMNGQEIGADCYIDMISREVVSIFTKKKLLMRAGETDKAISFKNEDIFSLTKYLCQLGGFSGAIDIDIFEVDNEYYISEINPRFGGGYPHAHECGVNHIKCVINNINKKNNIEQVGSYLENLMMMKYNDILIKNIDDLENIDNNMNQINYRD